MTSIRRVAVIITTGAAACLMTAPTSARQSAAVQSPAMPPKFEVVSIKVVDIKGPLHYAEPYKPGGSFSSPRISLATLITFAYDVRRVDRNVVGEPDWADKISFAIEAKPADGFPNLPVAENRAQISLMLQGLLADRFHFAYHREARDTEVYALKLDKGGPKNMTPVSDEVATAITGMSSRTSFAGGGMHMTAKAMTIADVAGSLTRTLDRPVVDQTGLKGHYQFDVAMNPPPSADPQPAGWSGSPDQISMVFSELPRLLGLRLVSTRAPIEYFVVDHVEQPTGN